MIQEQFSVNSTDKRIKSPLDAVIRRAERFGKTHPELEVTGCRGFNTDTGCTLTVIYRDKANAHS